MKTVVFQALLIWHTSGLKLYPPSRNALVESVSEEEVPGVQYVGRGYNIFFGNPHTTAKVDDGISGAIFDLTNRSNGQIYNGYLVPNGVSILPASTCAQTFKYNAVTGVNSYSSTLKESASVDADFSVVSFSASTDYQRVYSTTTKTASVYTSTYTQCACYFASLNVPYALPSFSANFIGAIKNMPLYYNATDETNLQFFYDFFTKYFGTHFIIDITMGGIFGTLSSMDSFSYSKYESSNLEISVSAEYSTLFASGAASSLTTSQKQQASDFNSILNTQSVFSIGGDLPANNSAIAWQKSLTTKPMPIYYKFDTIPRLLTTYNFPDIDTITKKQTALQSALDDYCRLLSSNDTFGKIECSGYPPDPSIPARSIIKGFYAENKDKEPTNPYTGGYNCNEGYTPIVYSSWISAPGHVMYYSYYCLNLTQVVDGLHYFGGLYEVCTNSDESKPRACNIGNVFTGNCSCPAGFSSSKSFSGKSWSFQPGCGDGAGTSTVQVFYCYNASVPLSESVLGGTYRKSNNQKACGARNNQYTKTTSCPNGFTPYLMGKNCCYMADNCPTVFSNFICLNNVFPVG